MSEFAAALVSFPDIGRPIRDRTGLTGAFDVQLTLPINAGRGIADGPPNPGALIDTGILTTIQEQLGLTLEGKRDQTEHALRRPKRYNLWPMDFEVVGDITDVETIAAGHGIRDLARLRRLYGKGTGGRSKGRRGYDRGTVGFASPNGTGMKRPASVKRSSSARGISTRRRKPAPARRFVVCVRNEGYEASLERNKIYPVLPDVDAERDGDLRVFDESGEDYLFSADRFVAIEVPAAVRASLRKAAQG
jgi:hypothetical protein